MRAVIRTSVAGFLLLGSALPIAGQSTPSDPQGSAGSVKKAKEPVVMSGCITSDAAGREMTFTDGTDGTQYRLTGTNVKKFVGRHVQVVGGYDSRRLRVNGGLTPSPNIAAQAGAIDPGVAAVAALGGGTTGTGSPRLPEFRVARVSAVAGDCSR
jgi:hypothetical protein